MSVEVELLREAARVMRERAQAATPGPWVVHTDGEVIAPELTRTGKNSNGTTWTNYCYVTCDSEGFAFMDEADGAHIASWHPAVALAVAEWLDEHADQLEQVIPSWTAPSQGYDQPPSVAWNNPQRLAELVQHHFGRALSVARAYLGRQP